MRHPEGPSTIGTTTSSLVLSPKHSNRNTLVWRATESATYFTTLTRALPGHELLGACQQLLAVGRRQAVDTGHTGQIVGIAPRYEVAIALDGRLGGQFAGLGLFLASREGSSHDAQQCDDRAFHATSGV